MFPDPGSTKKDDNHKHTETKQNTSHSVKYGFSNLRSKRDSSEIDEDFNEEKRVRDFVGKRFHDEDKVMPLDITLFMDYPSEHFYPYDVDDKENNEEDSDIFENHPEQKRLRDFVGKRSDNWGLDSWSSYDKRLRDFVGKRGDDKEKRLREFVGKRMSDFEGKAGDFLEENAATEKRLRDFVGKRGSTDDADSLILLYSVQDLLDEKNRHSSRINNRPTGSIDKQEVVELQSDIEKRLRDFIGKRTSNSGRRPYENIQKRIRDFVGKRDGSDIFSEDKRIREFVGKRDSADMLREDKRIREFIGKRADKRPREFIGKRTVFSNEDEAGFEEEKRVRDFVGKRWGAEGFVQYKRPREFVGKRLLPDNDFEDPVYAKKRVRDFVGKRDYVSDLDRSNTVKRIREFIGKR